jgi:hypothetical protein
MNINLELLFAHEAFEMLGHPLSPWEVPDSIPTAASNIENEQMLHISD